MFDAVIFDLDGTLIDTERLAMTATITAFHAMGFTPDPDFLHRLVGQDMPTGERMIATQYPTLDLADLDRRVEAAMKKSLLSGMPMKPGVRELLAAITLPKVIVTSSSRSSAARKVAQADLGADFVHIVTLDDVTRAKPAPDPYLLAAKLLGVPPEKCVVFEDSEIGAQSAHNAGMHVVQVPDVVPSQGHFAHHLAVDILSGARAVGLI